MTTHEMILLCSSLQGVGMCILLCLVVGVATFAALGKLGSPHLRLEACRSMSQPGKCFLGTVGASEHLPRVLLLAFSCARIKLSTRGTSKAGILLWENFVLTHDGECFPWGY